MLLGYSGNYEWWFLRPYLIIAARDPYKAAAAASFKTVIDSISLGLIEDKIFELDSFSSAIELYPLKKMKKKVDLVSSLAWSLM